MQRTQENVPPCAAQTDEVLQTLACEQDAMQVKVDNPGEEQTVPR